jgi:hypothetical protein
MSFRCKVFNDFDGNDFFEIELDSRSTEEAALQALEALGYRLGKIEPKLSEELEDISKD